jgi:hypothetical protein
MQSACRVRTIYYNPKAKDFENNCILFHARLSVGHIIGIIKEYSPFQEALSINIEQRIIRKSSAANALQQWCQKLPKITTDALQCSNDLC